MIERREKLKRQQYSSAMDHVRFSLEQYGFENEDTDRKQNIKSPQIAKKPSPSSSFGCSMTKRSPNTKYDVGDQDSYVDEDGVDQSSQCSKTYECWRECLRPDFFRLDHNNSNAINNANYSSDR